MRAPVSVVALLSLVFACACGQSSPAPEVTPPPAVEDVDAGQSPAPDAGSPPRDAGSGDAAAEPANVRILAGNISSGSSSTYDSGEGIRMLQGLHPDIAMLQELVYGANGDADVRAFVDKAFGSSFVFFRESGVQIPNAVVSRFPILASGRWVDPKVANRSFVYAKIAVPGPHPLWAVSVHLLTTNGTDRNAEATSLVAQLKGAAADGDYVVIGGDFNTDNRTEPCLSTFAQIVATDGEAPADQQGNDNTNGPRSRPYDWVLVDRTLAKAQRPTVIGGNSFAAGLVFDSRVYTPLADVAPVQKTDSDATNMQHMPVVKDFYLAQ
jgi:endonuclease/exonuclease/phosphatase family metal-dependent hydrolase